MPPGPAPMMMTSNCINDSSVSSDSGSYCGGIAGASYSTIRGSWSRSTVSAVSYCGGIAGYGSTLIGNGVIVRFDDSDIDIEEFCGAVCGDADADGVIKDNIYIKGNFGGIDGISYAGKADPCSYEVLSEREDFPESFSSFEVLFVEGDTELGRSVKKYGERITDDFYTFPTAEKLSTLTVADFEALGTGYRAKYLEKLSKDVATGKIDLEKIKALPLDEARSELLKIYGVGIKVANCALLFGFGFYDAFPVDVWMKRVMEYYPNGLPKCFEGIGGIAQQYLFHWARNNL